ncbi:hypothetical protein RI129_007736 [Pyrocoelia pectoralis]|uniref:Uncharacterized protein n=1 Tax=Pyrocoelia pectoralis TaxID=417401 RepID=A0AAN7VF08_9COLE
MEQNPEKREEILKAIGRIEADFKLKAVDNRTTTKEDVTSVLLERAEQDKAKGIQVGELRPNRNETQAVTITVEEEARQTILKHGRIRMCSVERRVKLQQYFRCWSYNHKKRECEGPDRTNLCHRSGAENHIAKQYHNGRRCLLYNEDDHSSGSGSCGHFRAALLKERRTERETGNKDRDRFMGASKTKRRKESRSNFLGSYTSYTSLQLPFCEVN